MSEVVRYRGRLREVENEAGLTVDELCKKICIQLGEELLPTFYSSYREQLADTYDYVAYKDRLYEIVEKQLLDPSDSRYVGVINEDSSIEFDVQYYTGGCNFDEALSNALESVYLDRPKNKAEYYKSKIEALILQAKEDGVTFTTEQIEYFNSIYLKVNDSDNHVETVRLCDFTEHNIVEIGK